MIFMNANAPSVRAASREFRTSNSQWTKDEKHPADVM